MFPLWLAIVITFFVWLLIIKTNKHLSLLWKKKNEYLQNGLVVSNDSGIFHFNSLKHVAQF